MLSASGYTWLCYALKEAVSKRLFTRSLDVEPRIEQCIMALILTMRPGPVLTSEGRVHTIRPHSVPVSMMVARSVMRSISALHRLGVGNHRGPFGERQIGGDDYGRLLGAFGDNLEQKLGAHLGQWHVSHLIERDQIVTGPACQRTAELQLMFGLTISLISPAALAKRTRRFCRQRRPPGRSVDGSYRYRSPLASLWICWAETLGLRPKSNSSSVFMLGRRASRMRRSISRCSRSSSSACSSGSAVRAPPVRPAERTELRWSASATTCTAGGWWPLRGQRSAHSRRYLLAEQAVIIGHHRQRGVQSATGLDAARVSCGSDHVPPISRSTI